MYHDGSPELSDKAMCLGYAGSMNGYSGSRGHHRGGQNVAWCRRSSADATVFVAVDGTRARSMNAETAHL